MVFKEPYKPEILNGGTKCSTLGAIHVRLLIYAFLTLTAPPSLVDIEDMKKRLRLSPSRLSDLPLLVEVNLFTDNSLASEAAIDSQLRKIRVSYPKDVHCVLKVSGRLSTDMESLNDRILYLNQATKSRILVQLSFERLSILAHLPNSCFLKSNVYPSVKCVSFKMFSLSNHQVIISPLMVKRNA